MGKLKVVKEDAAPVKFESSQAVSDIERYSNMLGDEDPQMRRMHLNNIVAEGQKAIGPLTRLLHDPNVNVRVGAAAALPKIISKMAAGGPKAVDPLLSLLDNPESLVRLEAIKALSKIKDKRANPYLIARITAEPVPAWRHAIFDALIEINPADKKKPEECLKELLSKDRDVRALAIISFLHSLDPKFKSDQPPVFTSYPSSKLVKALRDSDATVRTMAAFAVAQFSLEDSGPMIEATRDTAPAVRLEAVEALRKHPIPKSLSIFMERLKNDKDPDVAAAAAEGMKAFPVAENIPVLISMLSHPNGSVRAHIVDGICTTISKNSDKKWNDIVDPLIRVLDDPVDTVRSLAIRSLEEIGDLRAIDALARVEAKDPDHGWEARKAIDAMIQIDPVKAAPKLIGMLSYESGAVRLHAVTAIYATVSKNSAKKWNAIVDPLIKALDDPEDEVRRLAIRSLGEIGDLRAIDALLRIETKDKTYGVEARQAINNIERKNRKAVPKRAEEWLGGV